MSSCQRLNRRELLKRSALSLGGAALFSTIFPIDSKGGALAMMFAEGTDNSIASALDSIATRLRQAGADLPKPERLGQRLETLIERGILKDSWDALTGQSYRNLLNGFLDVSSADAKTAARANILLFLLEENEAMLGRATIVEGQVVEANAHARIAVHYKPGRLPLETGDRLVLVYPFFSGQDLGELQAGNPKGANYIAGEVIGEGDIAIEAPWAESAVTGRFRESRALIGNPADAYVFRLGGNPGWKQQSFNGRYVIWLMLALKDADDVSIPVSRLVVDVRSGPAAEFRVIVPSVLQTGELCRIHVSPLDKEGNITRYPNRIEQAALIMSGKRSSLELDWKLDGTHWVASLPMQTDGVCRIEVGAGQGALKGRSNPVVVRREPCERLYWGDAHAHSELSDAIDTTEYFHDYARNMALCDYVSLTDHSDLLTEREWREIEKATADHEEPGRFATLLGYEWSNENANNRGGHFNFYFARRNGKLLSAAGADVLPAIACVDQVGDPFLVIPHAHKPGDWTVRYPEQVRVVEIYSQHAQFEWFGRRFLETGNKVGFIGGSDSHMANPGHSCTPGSRPRWGLGGIFARTLDHESLWRALWERHCYATTGERIFLELFADDRPMGHELSVSEVQKLELFVAGTAPLLSVDLIRNGKTFKSWQPALAPPSQTTRRLRLFFNSLTEPDSPLAKDYFPPTKNWGEVTVRLNGNELAEVRAFNRKRSFVTHRTGSRAIEFRLLNRGDECGYLMDLKTPGTGELSVTIHGQIFTFDLSGGDPVQFTHDIGIFGLQRLREDDSDLLDCRQRLAPVPITQDREYFYLRVLQIDGMQAWSSPVFIERKA